MNYICLSQLIVCIGKQDSKWSNSFYSLRMNRIRIENEPIAYLKQSIFIIVIVLKVFVQEKITCVNPLVLENYL